MVYLLHFHSKISPAHTCQHYIGYALDVKRRINIHRTNPDARLLQVARDRGIGFAVVRLWEGGYNLEKKLKKLKNAPKLCPICSQTQAQLSDLEFQMLDCEPLGF